jgi:ketosteroid isomerase-like protein
MKRLSLSSLLVSSLILSALAQEKGLPSSLASLVESERAFARTSVEKGVRDSFLMFFADDGINFRPHPTNTREALMKLPPPASPSPNTLNWAPIFGDISRAGDLGYTTGPYWITEIRAPEKPPLQHGYFFSIWKKQAQGDWKVVLDLGISTPAPTTSKIPSFQGARQVSVAPSGVSDSLEAQRRSLLELDRSFSEAAKARGTVSAFLGCISDDARMYRNGLLPLLGKGAIRAFLSQKPLLFTCEPLKSDASISRDLGYTYGKYEIKGETSTPQPVEKGYYVRMWKLIEPGKWRAVLEVTTALPAESWGSNQ